MGRRPGERKARPGALEVDSNFSTVVESEREMEYGQLLIKKFKGHPRT